MAIKQLLDNLKIKFKEIDYYVQAFTHPSSNNNPHLSLQNYQRLEFLGDAIIGFYVALETFLLSTNLDEGKMSLLKAKMISRTTLSKIARDLNLQKEIKIGSQSKELKENDKILSDVFEALIAAIYLDLGLKRVKQFLDKTLGYKIKKKQNDELKNPKTILQEYLQQQDDKKYYYDTIFYDKQFLSKIIYNHKVLGKGQGTSRRRAEVQAAREALKKINKEGRN